MVRLVEASVCLVALFDDDGSAWFGAAASDDEDLWRRQRVERPEPSILFEVADRGRPIVVEDAEQSDSVRTELIRRFGIKSVLAQRPQVSPKTRLQYRVHAYAAPCAGRASAAAARSTRSRRT